MAQSDGKVPINQTVRAGYAFMSSSLPVTFPAGVFVAVFAAAAQVLTAADATGVGGPLGFLFVTLVLLGSTAYAAFLYRLALREDASGFFGLKLGPDEGRLLGVTAGLVFVLGVLTIVGVLILALAISVALSQNGISAAQLQGPPEVAQKLIVNIIQTPAGAMFWLLLAGLVIAALWVSIRLALAAAATIGEARIMLFSTFAWTRGNVMNIFLAILPALGPQAVIALIAEQIAGADLLSIAIRFVLAVVQIGVLTPVQVGMYAFLYKGLRPPDLARAGVFA